MCDQELCAAADLSSPVDRLMLADVLADAGRTAEEAILRRLDRGAAWRDGKVIQIPRPLAVRIDIGTVSHGTMRPDDVLPAMMEALDSIKHDIAADVRQDDTAEDTEYRIKTVGMIDNVLGAMEARQEDDGYWNDEQAVWDMDEVAQLLESFSPPYVYFGAHPGDGSDYGFWPAHESAHEDAQNGELPSGDELPDEAPDGQLFLHVNERGNIELYRREGDRWESIWVIV